MHMHLYIEEIDLGIVFLPLKSNEYDRVKVGLLGLEGSGVDLDLELQSQGEVGPSYVPHL